MVSSSSLQPSPRRVLGDVTNSVKNAPGRHNAVAKDMGKAALTGSPLKQKQSITPARNIASKDENIQPPSGSSRKRQFEELDAEDDADAKRRSPYRMMEMGSATQLKAARPPTITIMPLPDDTSSTSEDVDEESPSRPRADSQDASDAEAIAEPIYESFSSFINYDEASTPGKSARASLEPKEPEPAPTVRGSHNM
ncbi:hypothetical protein FKW77_006933 [Venturia effusa]|uniref:Uncharacterized protein n=1 Tax=Venturia effusa TaxID=50376 RepID=A0A517LE04_9PEZI|nr:hypothetical protein FKW77_006933 [Venturia effusa]